MITFLILAFTALQSPLTWGSAWLPGFAYGVGITISGFVFYKLLRGQIPATPLDPLLLLLWLVALISTQFSIWHMGSQVRVVSLMAYIAAYYFIGAMVSEETLIRNILWAGFILIITYLCLGIYRLFVPPYTLHDLGNSNVLASILLLILPFGTRLEKRYQWLWFVAGALAMLTTHSRGGLLGLAMALGVLWKVDKRLIVGAGVLSLPVLFLWKKGSALVRLCYWGGALQAWLSSPWIGIGPASSIKAISPLCGHKVPHAHNIFLTFLAEMGLAGLLCLGLLLWQIWRHRRPGPAWAALCGFAIHSLVDDPIWFWAPGLGVMSLLAIMIRGEHNGK